MSKADLYLPHFKRKFVTHSSMYVFVVERFFVTALRPVTNVRFIEGRTLGLVVKGIDP